MGRAAPVAASTRLGYNDRVKRLLLATTFAVLPLACSAQEPDFLSHLAELADGASSKQQQVLEGVARDLLLVSELRSMGAGEFWGDAAKLVGKAPREDRRDPLPAILDFDTRLDEDGILWVFVPVPAKVAVDPRVVPGAPKVAGRADRHHVAFYELLRRRGVPVVDPWPTMRDLVATGERAHCETDTHWTSEACARVAKLVREHVGAADWLADAKPGDYEVERKPVEFVGDMHAMLGTENPSKEKRTLAFVKRKGAVPANDPSSPILLVGDSHCLVFRDGGDMHAKGAGFADHLAAEFGLPIHTVGVRGSGATQSRVSAFRAKAYDGKKLVIWCLSAREFTQAQGWSKVPLRRKNG